MRTLAPPCAPDGGCAAHEERGSERRWLRSTKLPPWPTASPPGSLAKSHHSHERLPPPPPTPSHPNPPAHAFGTQAAELFSKAGNLFKVSKNWNEAGAAFERTAQCHLKLQSAHEAASSYQVAAPRYPTPRYPTLPHPTLPHPTLPHATPPHPTPPHATTPHPTPPHPTTPTPPYPTHPTPPHPHNVPYTSSPRQDAANCYKKIDSERAVLLYSEAVAVYIDLGRFTTAAKLQKEIGELKEAENDLPGAADAYQQAADFYAGEESSSQSNQCLLKVTDRSPHHPPEHRALNHTLTLKPLTHTLTL